MTEKILNELSLKKKLTLLDSINLEIFLGIFVSIFNFFEFKFKSFESGRYVPVQTGTGDHRYHRYSRYIYRPVCTGRANPRLQRLHHDGHVRPEIRLVLHAQGRHRRHLKHQNFGLRL
jgi:hypothetical protein